jgi:beta-galactosidase
VTPQKINQKDQYEKSRFIMPLRTITIAISLFFALSSLCAAAPAPRERLLLDSHWRFTLGDPPGAADIFAYPEQEWLDKTRQKDREMEARLAAERKDPVQVNLGGSTTYVQPGFDDHTWRELNLPHDWAVELPFGGGSISHGQKDINPKNGSTIGWYRRTFELPSSDQGRALWIEFDGIYRNSLVWLNGHCLGRHNSGYTSFHYNIEKYANFGGRNTLVVRADASRAEGWFYEGAGIYRHVWLVKTGAIHVAHWGTNVTSSLAGSTAVVTAATTLRNDGSQTAAVYLQSWIVGPNGETAAKSKDESVTLEPGAEQIVTPKFAVQAAQLWSPDHPNLYSLVSRVVRDEVILDQTETRFGIRTIQWTADNGFLLNGKRLEIKGVCNHQDHAGVGSAIPDRLNVWRLVQLQKMGCNAIRTSHNAPTPEMLDACDRLGLLVMDENRRFDTSPEVLGQLTSLIVRDRNHPSVVIWSAGNEEMDMQTDENHGIEILRTMQELIHKLDPSRPVTVANNGAWDTWGKSFSKINDVMGFNYYHNGSNDPDKYHQAFPAIPCVGTEEGSTLSTRGAYATDPKSGVMSAYDLEAPVWGSTAEKWWAYYQARRWIAGAFVWTGFDYRGEPTPYNFNYSSQFGQMDTCGFPKDNFYYYQSQWTTKPMVHVLPHWTWPGKEGQAIDVWVYTNCDKVDLILNGKSLGRQIPPQYSHAEWKVPYSSGTLLAKAYKQGKLAAQDEVETTGAAAAVKLTADRTAIDADGQDVSIITAAVVDAQGRVVPDAANLLKFDIQGGEIIGVGNGNPASAESDKAPMRHVFHGLAQVIVQSGQPGEIRLSALSDGLKSAVLEISAKKAMRDMAVP